MGSGTTGGRIGANVSRYLEDKYGKKRSNKIVGYVCILFSAICFYVYFIAAPQITVNDVISEEVVFTSFVYKNHRSSDEIVFKVRQKEYSIQQWVWNEAYSADKLWKDLNREKQAVESLGMAMKATIWLKNHTSNSILGIKTNTVSITPEQGIKGANKNNWYSLLLGIIFLGMSVYAFFKSK